MKTFLLLTALALPADDPVQASPAQQRIEAVLRTLAERPADTRVYNELAFAFARRARETADGEDYERGLDSLKVSELLAPGNLGARRVRAWLYLGLHRFEDALSTALLAHREYPDDLWTLGVLVDAYVELGNYAAAEESCQWMLDMRPGNTAGLTRAAYLRELFGDVEGALELMNEAITRTPTNETEDRAWILAHMAHLNRLAGRRESALACVDLALEDFPDYHYALDQLGRIRADQGEHRSAAEAFERRYAVARHPENLFDVATALDAADDDRAPALFIAFEQAALAEKEGLDNANDALVTYWLDYAEGRAADALRIARLEAERRPTVTTRSNLAWALSANGEHAAAERELEAVLAIGYRDLELHYRAGLIHRRAGRLAEADAELAHCIAMAPDSDLGRRAALLMDGAATSSATR